MIAIIDYDAGNTRSVINALKRLHTDYLLTDDPDLILNAEKVILPGVGHAAAAMNALEDRSLVDVIKNCSQPFLGVCLGMQLLYECSTEGGKTETLNIVPGMVEKFTIKDDIRIPHMGWNNNEHITKNNSHLLHNVTDEEETYFVHSYCAPVNEYTITQCTYYQTFTSYVQRDNFHGVQFHPEKSGIVGEKILQNFLEL